MNHTVTENTKKKKPPTTRLRLLKMCLKVIAGLLVFMMCMFSVFASWAWGGYTNIKPSLDAEFIATAEYLLEDPIESPLLDTFYSFQVQTNTEYTTADSLCFDAMSMALEDFSNLVWAEVYVNEQIVSRFHWDWPGFIWYTMPGHSVVCMPVHLESGIHIIEFRAKETAFVVPYYIRKWAIEIE